MRVCRFSGRRLLSAHRGGSLLLPAQSTSRIWGAPDSQAVYSIVLRPELIVLSYQGPAFGIGDLLSLSFVAPYSRCPSLDISSVCPVAAGNESL